jgi:hypothetical protein
MAEAKDTSKKDDAPVPVAERLLNEEVHPAQTDPSKSRPDKG